MPAGDASGVLTAGEARDADGAAVDHVVVDEPVVFIRERDESKSPVKEKGVLIALVKDEVIRALIALLLLALLALIVMWALYRAKTWHDTKELLDVVLPTVSALLGSAVGFYFGSKVGR